MTMRRLILTASVCAMLAAGCTPARLIASVDDYALYRNVRLAPTQGQRLQAAERYLAERPQGAFADELRALYANEEPAFFEHAKTSRSRALEYVTYLPRGPHAEAASSLLLSWDIRIEEGETASLLAAARRTEALLSGAAVQRQLVGETIFESLRALTDPSLYGARIEDVPPQTRRMLAGSAGATWGRMPTTTTRDLFFVVPTRLERESRAATLTLSVGLEGQRVKRGILSGPDLFVHWLEADTMTPLDPTDRDARARAAAHAKERLEGFFEASMPKERCGSETASPTLLVMRECDGWKLNIVMGEKPGDDDVVTVMR